MHAPPLSSFLTNHNHMNMKPQHQTLLTPNCKRTVFTSKLDYHEHQKHNPLHLQNVTVHGVIDAETGSLSLSLPPFISLTVQPRSNLCLCKKKDGNRNRYKAKNDLTRGRTWNLLIDRNRSQAPCHWAIRPMLL
jgi:hypothetical protein